MDTVFLALRVVVSLAAVFGALWFAHRWFVKGRGRTPRTRAIGVVARQGLGAKAGVAVVDAGGRRYLLGVTEHAVTVLDRLEVGGGTPVSRGLQVVSTAPVAIQTPMSHEVVAVTGPLAVFEEELRIATATGEVAVLPPQAGPAGPPTQTITLPPSSGYQSRRAAREAEQAKVQQATGPLAGSVLSPATWRQTVDALRHLR